MTDAERLNRDVYVNAIVSGACDEFLDSIGEALRVRRKALMTEAALRLEVGDKVRFADVPDNKDGWVGVTGEVVGKGRGSGKVSVRLTITEPRRVGQRRYAQPGQVWTVPADWVERDDG